MKIKNLTDSKLSRRRFILSSTGTGFAALLLACGIKEESASGINPNNSVSPAATPIPVIEASKICTLTPVLEEGPFYIEGANIRKNIRDDSTGQKLLLKILVVDANKNCQPIQNAVVNIWHCDAKGFYSGYPHTAPGFNGEKNMPPRRGMPPPRDGNFNGMPPPPPRDGQHEGMPLPPPNGNFKGMPPPNESGGMHEKPTSDQRFLRGVQITDKQGQVEFETVYPGWYEPRAVHIHTKIFLNDKEMLTSQMFFPEELNTRILTGIEPYKARGANPNKNADDPIAGTNPPLLTISEAGDTITASIIIGMKAA